jgi:hypothetical protein
MRLGTNRASRESREVLAPRQRAAREVARRLEILDKLFVRRTHREKSPFP